jgi:hypothetical protein
MFVKDILGIYGSFQVKDSHVQTNMNSGTVASTDFPTGDEAKSTRRRKALAQLDPRAYSPTAYSPSITRCYISNCLLFLKFIWSNIFSARAVICARISALQYKSRLLCRVHCTRTLEGSPIADPLDRLRSPGRLLQAKRHTGPLHRLRSAGSTTSG